MGNPLTDIIPARYRRVVYALVAFSQLVIVSVAASYELPKPVAVVNAIITGLAAAMAGSNTSPEE